MLQSPIGRENRCSHRWIPDTPSATRCCTLAWNFVPIEISFVLGLKIGGALSLKRRFPPGHNLFRSSSANQLCLLIIIAYLTCVVHFTTAIALGAFGMKRSVTFDNCAPYRWGKQQQVRVNSFTLICGLFAVDQIIAFTSTNARLRRKSVSQFIRDTYSSFQEFSLSLELISFANGNRLSSL